VKTVLFLGGNGHAPVRLEPAREALAAQGHGFTIRDLAYPSAGSFDELLRGLAFEAEGHDPGTLVYATGIGALVGLALRARGALLDRPLLLQGGVLWGLERRWFPRVMRVPPLPLVLAAAFRVGLVQRRFARRHFVRRPPAALLEGFFGGYRDARAFSVWFEWLGPGLLRRLERELPGTPGALDRLFAWWGGRDEVVGVDELRVTEGALGIRIPLRTFPVWGHYPMIDDPQGWVQEVGRAVENPGALP
jgi:hypothetical protein